MQMPTRMLAAAASVLITMTTATASPADLNRQYYGDAAGNPAAPPFSQAVLVGDTLYVAGHIGLDPATQQAVANVDGEARAVMDATKQAVEAAGLGMDDLVSVTIYCTDLDLYDGFNAIYRSYFHGHFPARAFIGVSRLVRGAHFEIAAVASRPAKH
jgi:2-iminobutanoate/2-iminopropanoate deaminase